MRERICRMICSTSTLSERTEKSDILFNRGASPLGLPYTRSRAPLRRRAPFAWLIRCAHSLSDDLSTIAAAGLTHPFGQELGRFGDAGAQDAERPDERFAAGQGDFRGVLADLREAVRVGRQRLPVAEQAAPRAREDVAHHAF